MSNKWIVAKVESAGVATLATLFSYAVCSTFGWIESIASANLLEVFAVWTSYACTYLCVKQDRWNYPIGMISTAAYTVLFYQQELYGLAALNVYLTGALIYGWFRWGHNENTRPVTRLKLDKSLVGYGAFFIVALIATMVTTTLIGGQLPILDATIFATSMLAQFLLDNKKLENWAVWVIVNIVSIITFTMAGLPFVVIQYVFFLMNTVYGWHQWKRSMENTNDQT